MTNRFPFERAVAVVTGASSGIGRRIALDLAGRGTTVVLVARGQDGLADVLPMCAPTAPGSMIAPLDVTDRAAVEEMIGSTLDRFGRIDAVINNAGAPARRHAAQLRPQNVEAAMAVNFMGAVFATLAVLPSMLDRRSGHIVNIGSVGGRVGAPRDSAYSAAKFALAGWSEALAVDLQGSGVEVHLITVGPIKTAFGTKLQEAPSYFGPFGRTDVVVAAVRRALERGGFEHTVPWWMRPVPWLRLAMPDRFISWTSRFDRRPAAQRALAARRRPDTPSASDGTR